MKGTGSSSRAVRFSWNMFWNISGQTALIVLSILLVPYIVRGLGVEGYALYGLIGLITGYLTLLTMGAGAATLKYVAEYLAKDDRQGLRVTWNLTLFFHVAGVLIGAAAVFLLRRHLVASFFNVDPSLQDAAAWVLACAAAGAVFFSLTQFAVAVFQGMQRFGLASLVAVLQTGGFLAGSAMLLATGLHLRAVGGLYAALHAVLAGVFLFVVFRLMRERIGPGGLHAAIDAVRLLVRGRNGPRPPEGSADAPVRERVLFGYAIQNWLFQIGWAVLFQWDKFVIGYFYPLSQLTYYLIPAFILQKFWVLPNSVLVTALPVISELSGTGDQSSLKKVHNQCSQLVLWLVLPGFIVLAVFAPHFLTLWLGSEFSVQGVWPLRFLLIGYFFYLLGSMPVTAAFGTGRPQYALACMATQAFVCVGFWVLLIPRYGIVGAALSFALAQILVNIPWVLFISARFFGMSPLEYLRKVLLRPLAAGVVLMALVWPLRSVAWRWPGLIALAAAAAAVYYLVGLRLLGREERDTLRHLLDAVLRRRSAQGA
ncbi:MAG: polysaccharide biosynthesis C-terminal domain-containing protein [Elusimicrobiota bacterium]